MNTIWFEHPDSGQMFDVVKGTVAERYARQQGCTEISDPSSEDQAPKPKAPKQQRKGKHSTNSTKLDETV